MELTCCEISSPTGEADGAQASIAANDLRRLTSLWKLQDEMSAAFGGQKKSLIAKRCDQDLRACSVCCFLPVFFCCLI
jgi:hypothetical protein